MPVYELTSAKTGQNYRVDFDRDPVDTDVDEAVNHFDNEFARQNGVDPAVLDQSPLGTVGAALRNIGPEMAGLAAGGMRYLDKAAEVVGNLTGTERGGLFGDVARPLEVIQQEGEILRPLNPANPTARTIGQGAAQGLGLLGAAAASVPALGARAMMAVPAALGFAGGAGEGLQTAEDMGITSPAAQFGMGTAFGAIEGATEMIGGIGGRFIPPMRGLPGAAASIATEAGEEMLATGLQDATTAGVGQFVSDPNRPGYTESGYKLPQFDAAMLERQKQAAIGGAAGGAVFAGVQALSPNDRLSPNQTPAQAGTPQAPGTTPATAPLAGAPGAVPSTLSRIAQESLDPENTGYTGELTEEEAAGLESQAGQEVKVGQDLAGVGQGMSGVGQGMSDPSQSPPLPVSSSSTASVTKDSGVTADQTAQNTLGAGLSPATGASLPAERTPEQIAESAAAEAARQSQIAQLRARQNQAGRGPIIPDSPLGVYDILDFVNENKIRVPRADSADRKAGEYDWTETYSVPQYYRKFLGSSERGGSIDQVAQQAFENGFIREPTADALMGAIQQGIDTRKQYKVQFAKRAQEQAVVEKQTLDFEKTQQTLRRKDKDQVRFEDIAPGDEMTIDGEQAVVKDVTYTEDGYLTNVVIEDGKRFGLMQFDPQTRSGLFVDEYTPKQRTAAEGVPEEPLFSRAAPRMDFSGLMQNAQAVASGAQAPQTSPALAGMINAPGQRTGPVPQQAGPRGVDRFFQPSPTTANNSQRLQTAYQQAVRGSSTQMLPIRAVYDAAKAQNPALTPAQFMQEVQAGDAAGTVLLEPFDTPQGLQDAGEFVARNASGVPSTRMMVTEAPLRNAADRATTAPMASDSGAAQNAEPSPGGLSEWRVPIYEPLPKKAFDLELYHGTWRGGYDSFKDGTHFSRSPVYAARYLNPSASSMGGTGLKSVHQQQIYKTKVSFRKIFDTRHPEAKKLFEKEFYQKWGNGTAISERGLPDWTDSIDLQEWLQQEHPEYDGMVLDEGAEPLPTGEVRVRPESYVPFSASQIDIIDSNFESSRAANGTSPSLPVSESPSLASPSELAANQKANEAILKNLGLPTAKGTRVWGAAKVKAALAKLSRDMRYPATTRLMARELANLSLDNLLLKIEADARLNWAGLYQPFTDGRGELSLNTRTMGRGEQDIGISLVHEALHHATYRALRAPKTARQKQAKADLEALFKRAKAALAANEQLSAFDYELSSLDEFITGLWTRADFQTALAGIPLENAPTLGDRVRSVLDEIFRVLAELVTMKDVPVGSVLEASMAATLRIMGDGKPSLQSQLKNAVMTQGPGPITIRPPSLRGIKAYHGTPHKVDKFTTAKIGTGEGAQAYGWGLYFAENKAVGAMYRDQLASADLIVDGGPYDAKNPDHFAAATLLQYKGDAAAAVRDMRAQAAEKRSVSASWAADYVRQLEDTIARIQRGNLPKIEERSTGNLYTVELIPAEADFLDWDKPLSEQSEKVKAAFKAIGIEPDSGVSVYSIDKGGLPQWIVDDGRQMLRFSSERAAREEARAISKTGAAAYQNIKAMSDKDKSNALAQAGISGIKYLDAGSRGKGDGSRNFVVFDEKDIRITHENEMPLMNPASEQRENRSRMARPEEAQRMYEPQGNDIMLAEAAQWLGTVDNATAVQQLETGNAPAGLRKDHLPALAEQTMQRLVQTMASDKELVRLQAEALLDRAGIAWQDIINREAGRSLQQVGAANARLLPIAPVLAAKRILVDRAKALMDKRFTGGAEGAVEKVKAIIEKVDADAGNDVAQAVQDTVELAPPVDPAAAKAAVQAVTKAASTYFGGSLPARVKILHQEQAEWDARMNGSILELNAAALETAQVAGKIEHEIGHLLFQDPAMRQQFDALWSSLDVNERAQIENITAALYDAENRNEEASVRALDTVRQLVETKNPGLWQRFVAWIRQAWERLTGKLPRDPRRLAAVMIETGVARLKGVEGNQTDVRESRRSDLLKVNSPQLAKLLNAIRSKVSPGMKWRDIFESMPSAQKERQLEIYKRLMQHAALVKLSANERLQLTNELDKAWQRARKKIFDKELEKAGVLGEKDTSDRKKVKAVLPKLLRMINLGMFDSAAWRDAVAPQYGLKMLTSADTAQLRTLAEAAWKLPEGVLRNRKLRDLLNGIQTKTAANWVELINSYWTAAVLSGLRTQFDTWMAAVNGMGTNLMQIGGLIARGQGKAAIDAHAQWWRGLMEGVRESGQILFKGDTSYLKRFGADLMKALEGETSVTPVPLGENLWNNGNKWQKYGLAPVMMFTGRLMAAADHINNTATTQGAIAVARALHPELYEGKVAFTETERATARAQALQEVTGGREPQTAEERSTLTARVRELLNGTVNQQDYAAASEIGDMAAFQNDPTGVFGTVYSAMKQGLGSIQRGLGEVAADVTANKFARVTSGIMAGSLHGITGTRFMRFGANFGAEMTRYIPGSYVLGKAGFYGRNVSRMQQELLLGKNLVGLMLGSTLAAVFLSSDDDDEGWQIEGDWSTLNPQQAKERMSAGLERLTLWKRDGDKVRRVSYKQWPTMGLFSVVGGMLDEKRHKPAQWADHGTAGHLLRGLATGYVQVKNVSAVRNLVELFGEPSFSADGVTGAIDKFVKTSSNFVGGLVPTLAKDVDIWTDSRNFKPEGVADQFLRSVPIARKYINDGRPQLNMLGEEVKLQRSPWSRAYTSVDSAEAHRVLGALLARGLALPMPSDQIHVFKNGVKMPLETLGKEAVWKYEKAVGTGYKQWLSTEGRDLLQMPVEEADKTIQRRAKEIKNTAKAALVR